MPDTISHYEFDLNAYCKRVGYTGPLSPTLATLNALHELHPAAFTFEAIDVLLGRGIDLNPAAIDAKMIGQRRGGYCFEQNNLFKRALVAMGFEVECLLARVLWGAPAGAPLPARTHMLLKVIIDGSPWLADVGFGACVPTKALRMRDVRPQETRHNSFRLGATASGCLLEVLLDNDWAPIYEFLLEPQLDIDLLQANWFTSTHPSSRFRQHLIVTRTTPIARYGLFDNRLTIRRVDEPLERNLLNADEIVEALGALFNLSLAPEWAPMIEQAVANGLAQSAV